MTSPMIQKDIVTACKIETTKAIIEELNSDYFALLVDESFDTSCKEQMAIVLQKIMGMVELYPDDFDEFSMGTLENQLASFIIDVRDVDERFSDLHGLCDLSKRLVQTKKHSNYALVFLLVKLALLLPVATASVEEVYQE
uniref:Uncharacterized protein LOC104235427 n=1 Tax=Nicotiana sylvestris TaxID=4096 RepID=A0A1U7X5W6_NICSY|nr:PREDICTED: uncharacterized protein LOC104235427 [Nicotiana sylvestris]